ncbi:hypothetical protein VC83_02701 [Pseudogymnoascus destructans]|uniref:Uncharacterized protein n=1 Tax=Pseudogymnoascus destructans TaxID=655981 RepID=A0A177AG74_9PEZI|nr:uncharacterized protein VC83_02701 [Pseudogymnoascus destructans]OAF61105.1 hypothetical protein VC83_02701 [Pseudogymnoascus destructans]
MGLSSSSRPPAWRRYTANGRTNSFKEDLAKLGLLESASNDVYPQLTASNLKQLRINLDSKPTANFKPTFALKIQRPLLEVTDKETRRSLAAYNSPSGERGMVHSASARHPDLHTIDCLGYTDDTN